MIKILSFAMAISTSPIHKSIFKKIMVSKQGLFRIVLYRTPATLALRRYGMESRIRYILQRERAWFTTWIDCKGSAVQSNEGRL